MTQEDMKKAFDLSENLKAVLNALANIGDSLESQANAIAALEKKVDKLEGILSSKAAKSLLEMPKSNSDFSNKSIDKITEIENKVNKLVLLAEAPKASKPNRNIGGSKQEKPRKAQ